MKREKIIAAGLVSALIFTSLAASCSKQEKTETTTTTTEASKETTETEPEQTEPTQTQNADIYADIDYGLDFEGSVKVDDDTPDLFTEGHGEFVPSDDYGYIYPYSADRSITEYKNFSSKKPNANESFYAENYAGNCGFCSADGTILTDPVYGIAILEKDVGLYEEEPPILYCVSDSSGKTFLTDLKGSKRTPAYDSFQNGTEYHKDWIFCYDTDFDKDSTTLTVYDEELNILYNSIEIPMSFIIEVDGVKNYRRLFEFVDEDHFVFVNPGGWGSDLYNRKTNSFLGAYNVYLVGDSLLLNLEDGKFYLTDFDGNPLTPGFDNHEYGYNEYSYVPFYNFSRPNVYQVYDTKGNFKGTTTSEQMSIFYPGELPIVQNKCANAGLEIYDPKKNYVETIDSEMFTEQDEYGEFSYYFYIPDPDNPGFYFNYDATDCGDGFFEFEKGYVRETKLGGDSYIIYDKDFNPIEEVDGLYGKGNINGEYITLVKNETEYVSLETDEHYTPDQVTDFEEDNIRVIPTANGRYIKLHYDHPGTVCDAEGNILIGFDMNDYIMKIDPVTGYHYLFWSTTENTSFFSIGFDYDYYSAVGFNRIYCVEQDSFINLDFPRGTTEVKGIIDSHLILSVNNFSLPMDIAAYTSTPLDLSKKGFTEIYDVSDPSDPILKFHYTETDTIETIDLQDEKNADLLIYLDQ